jgi:hypothetical protein
MGGIYQGDICQSNEPEGLRAFSELIPEETELLEHVKKYKNGLFTKNLIIQAKRDTFFNQVYI